MVNKTPQIMEHLLDRDPSIVFLSETWLKSKANDVTAMVKSAGYILLHDIRKNRIKVIGGGVGVLLKSTLKYKQVKCKTFASFECTMVNLFLPNSMVLLLVSIYRVLFVSPITFLEEVIELFELLNSDHPKILLCGDVNLHMDEDERYSNQFKDILLTFNIQQHVNVPTHKQGHTLDIIATYDDGPTISDIQVNEYDVSHHFLVDFNVAINPCKIRQKIISFRDLKNIDSERMLAKITNKLQISDSRSFGDNIHHYNEVLSSTLNDEAPIKSRTIKVVPNAPWFDKDYANLRKERRKAEKLYRRTGLLSHKTNYNNLRKQSTQLAHQKKCQFYREKLEAGNAKLMYSSIRQLLDRNKVTILPERKHDVDLANLFSEYFTQKIDKIRTSFDLNCNSFPNNNFVPCPVVNKLSHFIPATEDEVREIVISYGIKCSPEDPFPSSLLVQYQDLFLPIWTKLVNLSLATGSMDCLKNAIIFPLIKDMDNIIDKDNMKNYRPVSNLLFVGKLIERIVSAQLDKHMKTNDLEKDYQFGYKSGHSCETLLLKVVNDLLMACDNNLPTILILLDLSAAFDTIEQKICLEILHDDIGVEGVALKWFESFLIGRTQKVKIGNSYSNETHLRYGAPQGSVLAPRLFNIYTRSLKKHMEPSKFSIFGFADDHQLLKSFLSMLQIEALGENLQHCFDRIAEWMNRFCLKLNTGKTKILIVAPPAIAQSIVIRGTFVNNDCIRFVHSAKNLGVILDDELHFKHQITNVVRSCLWTIRELSKIKPFLTYNHLRTAISSFVFSKLDYCNALYYGVNSDLLKKMQSVQNSAARLIKSSLNTSNISVSDVIKNCHWLRVRERIFFKLCLTMHKCVHGLAPKLISDLVTFSTSSRTKLLTQCQHNSKFGDRCFARIGPKMWNLLPIQLRFETNTQNFKAALKTLLFDDADKLFRKLSEK